MRLLTRPFFVKTLKLSILYGFASGVVTTAVIMDYLANLSVYTNSYLLGAPPFILLNLVVTLFFIRYVLLGEERWYVLVVPIIAYVLIVWLFHGLNPLWRTIALSAMMSLGIVLIWISWRSADR